MYLPAAFQQTDLHILHDFSDKHGFALLTTMGEDEPWVSHLPVLLDRAAGPRGTLLTHMARANPHWRYADGEPARVVFAGPHAYITPTWYAAEHVVPTWNYMTVHALGECELVLDPDEILDIVTQTVRKYEAARDPAWTFDPTTNFARRLAEQIVGLRIEITRLEGKWKLSQNQPVERRRRVIDGLRADGTADGVAIAAEMERALPG
jgi:transcriptional regulator